MSVFLRLLVLMALISGLSPVPQETVPLQKALQYEVTVSLKLIQVYVTDNSSKPVTDLKKEDFVVFDNGRSVAVTDFERHIVAMPSMRPEAGLPSERTVTAALPAGRLLRRKFFLFFDFAFNNPRGIIKAKQAALHFIDTQARPDDELGVLSYSVLKGLALHEYLTTDHRKIRSAVEAVGIKALAGRAEDIEEEYWRQAGEAVGGDARGQRQGEPIFNWRRQESKNQAENFILKLTAMAKALRYVPGQKQIVLFSTGVPSSLIYGHQVGRSGEVDRFGQQLQGSKFETGDRVLRVANEEMYKEFSASNCTLYAFDTREAAMVSSLFNYDEQTLLTGYRDLFTEQGVHSESTTRFRDEKVTGRDSLKRFSDITGGKYFSNINEYEKNLGEVQNLTGTFYVLGYYVDEQPDGKFRGVKVEVKRKDCRVRAQAGYFNPKPFREYSDLERQLHLFDLALNGRSTFGMPEAMAVTALFCPAPEGAAVQLLSKMPGQAMAKFSAKKLEFVAVILDAKDNIVSFQRTQGALTDYGDSDVVIASGADLKAGSYKCRIIMRDLETGMTGLASTAVEVPESPPSGLSLRPPLLLVRDIPPVYVSTESVAKRNAPGWKEIYLFDQTRFAPIIGDAPRSASKIFAVIPYSFPGSSAAGFNWTAHLVRLESGERVPLMALPLAGVKAGDLIAQFLEIPVEGLSPGKYDLYLHAENTASGEAADVRTPLTISP